MTRTRHLSFWDYVILWQGHVAFPSGIMSFYDEDLSPFLLRLCHSMTRTCRLSFWDYVILWWGYVDFPSEIMSFYYEDISPFLLTLSFYDEDMSPFLLRICHSMTRACRLSFRDYVILWRGHVAFPSERLLSSFCCSVHTVRSPPPCTHPHLQQFFFEQGLVGEVHVEEIQRADSAIHLIAVAGAVCSSSVARRTAAFRLEAGPG